MIELDETNKPIHGVSGSYRGLETSSYGTFIFQTIAELFLHKKHDLAKKYKLRGSGVTEVGHSISVSKAKKFSYFQ